MECVPDYGFLPVISASIYLLIGYLFSWYGKMMERFSLIEMAISTLIWPVFMLLAIYMMIKEKKGKVGGD